MILIELHEKLKAEGYTPYIHEDLYTLYCCIADEAGRPKFETMCQVRIENGTYTCMYFGADHNTKKMFGSGEDLVRFIQKKFPVQ